MRPRGADRLDRPLRPGRRAPRSSSSRGPASTAPCSTSSAVRTGRRARCAAGSATSPRRATSSPTSTAAAPRARSSPTRSRSRSRTCASREDDIAVSDVTSLNTLVISDDETTVERIDTLADGDSRLDPEHAGRRPREAKEQVPPRVRHAARSASARSPSCSTSRTSRCARSATSSASPRAASARSTRSSSARSSSSSPRTPSSSPPSAENARDRRLKVAARRPISRGDMEIGRFTLQDLQPAQLPATRAPGCARLRAQAGAGQRPSAPRFQPRSPATPPAGRASSRSSTAPRSARRSCTRPTASCTSRRTEQRPIVVIQVRDLDGNVIRTIPPSKALDVMSGAGL